MKRFNWISTLTLICTLTLIGCGGDEPDTTDDTTPSKQELAEQLESGKADSTVDWCGLFDWYGDDICDDFCLMPDPDCESDNDDTDNNDDGDVYEPCGGLACGELCTICDPSDSDCYETAVIKMCQPDGSCAASVPDCDDSGDDYDPCEGLACGESCSLCAPGDMDCYETAELKFCQADGTCMGNEPDTCDPDDTYDPCGGKMCGDTCSLCDPNDADCFETAVVKQCNDEGVCSAAAAVCM